MVEHQHNAHLDQVFRALADPTRRALLTRLSEGEHRVSDLAAPYDMSLAAVSKHIRTLERAGLVIRRIQGRTHHCRLNPAALSSAHEWLSFYQEFWTEKLDALERLFTFKSEKQNEE